MEPLDNAATATATTTDFFTFLYLHTLVMNVPVAWPNHAMVTKTPAGPKGDFYRGTVRR